MEVETSCSRSSQVKRPLSTPTKPYSKREANFSTPLYKVAILKDFSRIFSTTDADEVTKPSALLNFTEKVHSVGETSDQSNVNMPSTERKPDIQDNTSLIPPGLSNLVTLNFRAGMPVLECEILLYYRIKSFHHEILLYYRIKSFHHEILLKLACSHINLFLG